MRTIIIAKGKYLLTPGLIMVRYEVTIRAELLFIYNLETKVYQGLSQKDKYF